MRHGDGPGGDDFEDGGVGGVGGETDGARVLGVAVVPAAEEVAARGRGPDGGQLVLVELATAGNGAVGVVVGKNGKGVLRYGHEVGGVGGIARYGNVARVVLDAVAPAGEAGALFGRGADGDELVGLVGAAARGGGQVAGAGHDIDGVGGRYLELGRIGGVLLHRDGAGVGGVAVVPLPEAVAGVGDGAEDGILVEGVGAAAGNGAVGGVVGVDGEGEAGEGAAAADDNAGVALHLGIVAAAIDVVAHGAVADKDLGGIGFVGEGEDSGVTFAAAEDVLHSAGEHLDHGGVVVGGVTIGGIAATAEDVAVDHGTVAVRPVAVGRTGGHRVGRADVDLHLAHGLAGSIVAAVDVLHHLAAEEVERDVAIGGGCGVVGAEAAAEHIAVDQAGAYVEDGFLGGVVAVALVGRGVDINLVERIGSTRAMVGGLVEGAQEGLGGGAGVGGAVHGAAVDVAIDGGAGGAGGADVERYVAEDSRLLAQTAAADDGGRLGGADGAALYINDYIFLNIAPGVGAAEEAAFDVAAGHQDVDLATHLHVGAAEEASADGAAQDAHGGLALGVGIGASAAPVVVVVVLGVVVAVVAAAIDVALYLGLVGDVDERTVDAAHAVHLPGIGVPLVVDFDRVGLVVVGSHTAAGTENLAVGGAVDAAEGGVEYGVADGGVGGVAGAHMEGAAGIDPGIAEVDALPLAVLGVRSVDAAGNPGAHGAAGDDKLAAAARGGVGVAAAEDGAGDMAARHAQGAHVVGGVRAVIVGTPGGSSSGGLLPAGEVVGTVPGAERDGGVDEAALDAHAALAAVVVVVGGHVVDGVRQPLATLDTVHHHSGAGCIGLARGTVGMAHLTVDALLADKAALDNYIAVDTVLVLAVHLHVEGGDAEGAVNLGLGVLVDLVVEHRVEGLIGLAPGI